MRPEAPRAIASLRAAGWKPMLLSGDDPRIAAAIGAALGLAPADIIGGASPERKLDIIRELTSRGTTVMVGDGVNDAAALSAATVGIAVHGGAEAAMTAADAFLSKPGLGTLVELLRGARLTTRTIRRNLAASLLYNVLFGGLAIAGLVNPLVAAVLMPLSGITVVILSFRTHAFAAEADDRPGATV
jgi:Cu2+-exporting ATPase